MKNPERVAELLAELKNECEYPFELDEIAEFVCGITRLPRIEIVDDNSQIFRGVLYTKRPDGHYFRQRNNVSYALHRVVWESYYGEIPADHVIHHVDNNPANNNIENLQCLTISEHRKLHNAQKVLAICEVCGKTFETQTFNPRKTCSQKCYLQMPKVAVCVVCGKEFTTREKAPAQTCSVECAHVLRKQTRRNGTAKPHRGTREKRVCAICGRTYETRKDSTGKTCSPKCSYVLRQQTLQNHSKNVAK